MGNDLIFRILLGVLLIGFVANRGYYTRKFSQDSASTLPATEKRAQPVLASLLSLTALVATITYIVYPPWMSWASLPLPVWLRWLGLLVAALGFALIHWAQRSLGKNWSDTPRLMQDHALITDGPYHWVRHPIYTAFLIIMSATLFISANWFIGGLWVGMTAIEVMSRIQFEEALLREHFGDAYRVYMQQTGRLLPRIAR